MVKKYVKGAVFKYKNISTLVFELPEKELSTFPELFEALDGKTKNNEIVSYSVTASTMENVFLKYELYNFFLKLHSIVYDFCLELIEL